MEPESSSSGKGIKKRRGVSGEARSKVNARRGELMVREILQKRVSSFSAGVAIGGKGFVQTMAIRYQDDFRRKKVRKPRAVSGGGNGFFVMRE